MRGCGGNGDLSVCDRRHLTGKPPDFHARTAERSPLHSNSNLRGNAKRPGSFTWHTATVGSGYQDQDIRPLCALNKHSYKLRRFLSNFKVKAFKIMQVEIISTCACGVIYRLPRPGYDPAATSWYTSSFNPIVTSGVATVLDGVNGMHND